MNLGYVARWMVAGGIAVAVACGGSTSGTSRSSLESEDGGGSDASSDGGDGGVSVEGGSVDVPISSCGCEYRESECIDDDTARWFSMGCDAGVCEYTPHTEKCPPVADGPACKNGACPMVYVR